MATVYNQVVACRFGIELADLFSNEDWTNFEAAVAWVRRSGLRHLMQALTAFLERGGEARLVVGIDIENTSKEGLRDLLALQDKGNIRTFVNHNEHPSVVFHPKVYLFYNIAHAQLIVGSNNLTEAGLFTNTEAGLQVDAVVTDPVIAQMHAALDSWCDTTQGFARKLNRVLLTQLEEGGYILSEEALNRRRTETRQRRPRAGGGAQRQALFRSRAEQAPPPPAGTAPPRAAPAARRRRRSAAPTGGVGAVLLMRPRLARGTQMQIPIPLRRSQFLNGVGEILSDHDNVMRPISETHPGGNLNVNTYKMELPEGRNINYPVMRFWRTPEGVVVYRVHDANSANGTFILQRLEEGRHTNPPLTVVTKPNDPDHSTWYRFI